MTREFLLYIVFLVLVIVGVSIYVLLGRREGYYQWAGPVWGGPWNLPTRDLYYPYPYGGYPYGYSNKLFYDIRGPPLPYPPSELPGPNPSENTTMDDGSQTGSNAGPVGLQMPKVPVDESVNKTNNRDRALAEYERESKWWPGLARWGGWWGPMFNYGLMYNVDGKLKNSRNNSIVANHAWPWAWWW